MTQPSHASPLVCTKPSNASWGAEITALLTSSTEALSFNGLDLSEKTTTPDDCVHSFSGYGVSAKQGLSSHMEDSFSVQEKLSSPSLQKEDSVQFQPEDASISMNIPGFSEDMAFFSVFDGHGGDEVAQHCSDRLHQHFTNQLLVGLGVSSNCSQTTNVTESSTSSHCSPQGSPTCRQLFNGGGGLQRMSLAELDSDAAVDITKVLVTNALRASFHLTDGELAGTDAGEYVGATAVVAVIGKQQIWVAHCGDSRAVMQRNGDSMALTMDHKPDREDEGARIRAAGGRIVQNGGTKRVMGMLAMSRSIGDHYLRPYVIAEPEISCVDRLPDDEVLILATDGLWDVFSSTEATSLASRCISRSKERGMSRHAACRVSASILVKAAMERGSRDNITVIVVDISPPPPATLYSPVDGDDHAGTPGLTTTLPPASSSMLSNDIQPLSAAAAAARAAKEAEAAIPPSSTQQSGSRDMRRADSSRSLGKCVLLKSSSTKSHRHHHRHSRHPSQSEAGGGPVGAAGGSRRNAAAGESADSPGGGLGAAGLGTLTALNTAKSMPMPMEEAGLFKVLEDHDDDELEEEEEEEDGLEFEGESSTECSSMSSGEEENGEEEEEKEREEEREEQDTGEAHILQQISSDDHVREEGTITEEDEVRYVRRAMDSASMSESSLLHESASCCGTTPNSVALMMSSSLALTSPCGTALNSSHLKTPPEPHVSPVGQASALSDHRHHQSSSKVSSTLLQVAAAASAAASLSELNVG